MAASDEGLKPNNPMVPPPVTVQDFYLAAILREIEKMNTLLRRTLSQRKGL